MNTVEKHENQTNKKGSIPLYVYGATLSVALSCAFDAYHEFWPPLIFTLVLWITWLAFAIIIAIESTTSKTIVEIEFDKKKEEPKKDHIQLC